MKEEHVISLNVAGGVPTTVTKRAVHLRHLYAMKKAVASEIKLLETAVVADVCAQGELPDEGTVHRTVGSIPVTVVCRLRRTLDQIKAAKVFDILPIEVAKRVLPVTHKLVLRELRYLSANDSAAYRKVARTFTAVRTTPTVTFDA